MTRPHTYENSKFAFDYPRDWEEIEGVEFPGAERIGNTDVGDHPAGLDPDNWLNSLTGPGCPLKRQAA